MKVTVEYTAQIKAAAGLGSEQVEVEPGCTVDQLVCRLAEQHGDPLRNMVLTEEGRPSSAVLLFVGQTQVRPDEPKQLADGDLVTFLSPISGG